MYILIRQNFILAKAPPEPEPVSGDDKKRSASEEVSTDSSPPKRQQTETPAATPGEADASLQEKDTFSDISDDADDILNQEVFSCILYFILY